MAERLYIPCPPARGARNMALDEHLMALASGGSVEFALRTYSWMPACISLGRLQDASRELLASSARRDGLDLVRRPTGGRAVWHEHELTYSVVASGGHPLAGGSVESSLAWVGGALLDALARLGIRAAMSRGARSPSARQAASPCFVSHGQSEITAGGRKLVGSAQARASSAFLEHGSIVFRNDQPLMAGYVPGLDDAGRAALGRVLGESVASLSEIAPGVTPEVLAAALKSSFESRLGHSLDTVPPERFSCGALDDLEKARADEAMSWL